MQNTHRKEKLPELLKRLAAEFVGKESSTKSLITITDAKISDNQKGVQILFTTFPTDAENDALEFLNRKKSDFFEFVDKHARVGRMPEIKFAIDSGEKNRQRIDFLLQSE